MTTDQKITVFAAIFPVVFVVVGFLLNRLLEIDREDRHRAQEREWRRLDIQRQAIAEFQEALADLARGTSIAILINNSKTDEIGPLHELKRIDAPWCLDWLKAESRVVNLASRLNDPELKRLAREFVDHKNAIQSTKVEAYDADRMRTLLTSMDEMLRIADERVATVYHNLYAPEPPARRRFWQRLT